MFAIYYIPPEYLYVVGTGTYQPVYSSMCGGLFYVSGEIDYGDNTVTLIRERNIFNPDENNELVITEVNIEDLSDG